MGLLNLSISSRDQRNAEYTQSTVNHSMVATDMDALGTMAAEVTEVQVEAGEEPI